MLLWCLLGAGNPAAAQTAMHPGAVLRIIVPVSAGGSSDVVARLLGERLQDSLQRPVIVENRPGARGSRAADALASTAGKDEALLLTPVVMPVIWPLVYAHLQYNPARDFVPLSQLVRFDYALAVGTQHDLRTLRDLVKWVNAHPAAANFGTSGAGSVPHFLGTQMNDVLGMRMRMTHIPYRNIGTLKGELVGGGLTSAISATSDLIELHRAGRIRILATSGAARSPLLPNVPTFAELGYPTLTTVGWSAAYAAAGTSKAAIDRWSAAIAKALAEPALRRKLRDRGLEAAPSTPAQLAATMAADSARWAPIIEATGFKVE